ncbi:hypothetical protein ACOSQ4_011737 [Xanthoceras sorbifolium]
MRLENFETLITALIKYERLPDFCYGCGYIGHSVRECHNSEVRKSIMEGVEPKFGVWLRASHLDRSKSRMLSEQVQGVPEELLFLLQHLLTNVKVNLIGILRPPHQPRIVQ